MDLQAYFDSTEGWGVLSTADKSGRVDSALYARPHVQDRRHLSFIMADRLSHKNLASNGRAAYLFVAKGSGWDGVRLMLRKVSEKPGDAAQALPRRRPCPSREPKGRSFLVTFKIEEVRPLIGG